MNLERVIFCIKAAHVREAENAAKNLPEELLEGQEIIIERLEPDAKERRETYALKTHEKLSSIALPEGLSKIRIYRKSRPGQLNGQISFDCGEYHYLIPALED